MNKDNHIEGVRELIELLRGKGFISYCPDHIAERLITAFIQTREAGKWIPVTERLPEEGERVLILDVLSEIDIDFLCDAHENEGLVWEHNWDMSGITHWQPLPPAPSGESV